MSDSIPENVIFQSQPFDWQGRLYKACTAGFGFDLLTGRVLQNDVVMDVAMKALANGDVLDSGLPKKEPEWLLAGFAYAPSGSPLSRLLVDVECGGTSRRFLVEEKESFERLSLTWSNTWGSEEENPNGLPKQQIERAPVTDADTPFGTPASPGPRGAWPCRMRKMGTYDTDWLRTRWPGIPDDFDWAFYNLSQPSQRLPGAILGNESFRITNMHPLERVIEGRLPGKHLRLFVERDSELLEHAITADTIWFFPNALAGLLLFHALVECRNESASDIGGITIRLEPEEDLSTGAAARDGEEANNAEGEREEEKKGEKPAPGTKKSVEPVSLAMASSAPASKEVSGSTGAPSSPGAGAEQAPPSPQPQQAPTDYAGEFSKALDENLSEINAGLAEAGLPPLSQEQIAATRAKLDQMAKELSSFEKNVQQAQEPELASVLREAGISETKIADMEKAMALPMPDPALCRTESEWKLLVDQYLERFSSLLRPSKGMLETMRTTFLMQGPWGAAAAESLAEEQMRPEAVLSKIGMKPEKAAEFVRLLDQDLPEDPKAMNAFLADLEEAGGFPKGRLAEKMAAYESLLAKNGFSLKAPAQEPPAPAEAAGAQKTETASPEAEKMAEQGAPEEEEKKFTAESSPPTTREEVLLWLAGGHVLQGLSLVSVDLSGLDLSGQDMRDVDLSGGSLAGTRLNGANLSGAVLKKCDCTGANFTSASLRGAALSGATFDKAVLAETDMSGADATSVRARDAEFSKAVLAKTTLANGIFSDATFEHVAGEGVDAKGASFANARFRFCRFPSMRCEKADFSGADLHDSDFSRALFQGAVLKNASLCYGTRVAGADFEGAVLEDAVCTSVNGEGASFRAVSALKAVFSDSLFTASDWSGADLRFGDFSRSLLSASSMEGANLFQGVLREADLSSARLGNASLYGVDMTRMKTDGRTVFDNADLTNTILNARERGL